MTQLLHRAFSKLAKLPKSDQNIFAKWLLEELESEVRWKKSFGKSEKHMAILADEALKEHVSLKIRRRTNCNE